MNTSTPHQRDVSHRCPAPFGHCHQIIRRLLAVAMAVALGFAVAPLWAQTQAASVEGRVQTTANGNYLNNARVTVEGTTLEALTNSDGEYRLMNVPAGQVRIKVSYAGMESQSTTVSVSPGNAVRKDFELSFGLGQSTIEKDIVKLENFVVEATALTAAAAAVSGLALQAAGESTMRMARRSTQ